MAWPGFYQFNGMEIINVARTERYAKAASLPWFRPLYRSDSLDLMLGDSYSTPLQDDAPWVDERQPESFDFYGIYPLSIGGIEDSTWTATITENITDGGVVSPLRKATRTITFSCVLIGASEASVELGMRWIREVLGGGMPCNDRGPQYSPCGGGELCYMRSEPFIDPIPEGSSEDCLNDFLRTLREVTFTVGPTVIRKDRMTDGGAAWTISMTAVAANPYEWGQEIPLIEGFLDPDVEVPFVGGEVPDGASFDPDGFTQNEVICPTIEYRPVYDPMCPFNIPPVGVPSVDIACFDFPPVYRRRQFVIPPSVVPLWGEVVPYMEITAPWGHEVRNMRLRFYTDALESGDPNIDPCNFCGDIVFSYIPQNSTIIFDGSEQTVYLQDPGGVKRRADSLVFGSDGSPFEWPVLSCGVPYIVTIDLPDSPVAQAPVVDMSLFTRVA